MKQNHRIMWIHILIILLSLIFLIGVGIGSFVLIQNMFKTDTLTMESLDDEQSIVADIAVDDIAVNLIYEVDDENIIHAVIEIFNSNIGNIDYITIPSNTELIISKKVEKKLEQYHINFNEKSIRLDELIKYFDKDMYQIGQIIMSDVLGVDISYYTVFNKKNFVKYFVEDNSTFYFGKNKYEYELLVFSETFKTKLKQFDVQLEDLMRDSYEEMTSNFNLNNRLKYLPKYEKVDVNNIYNWHIMGEKRNVKFVIDTKSNALLIMSIMSRKEQYKITQTEYNKRCEGKIKK